MFYLLVFIATFALTAIFTGLIRKIALYFKIVDVPDSTNGSLSSGRKIHHRPIPLLGGLAIFLGFFSILLIGHQYFLAGNLTWSHLLGFLAGALIIMVGGFLDDKYNLRPYQQIIFPLLAIAAVILGGVEIAKITNPFGGIIDLQVWFFISPLIITVWLLGLMYTTKLLDGVDGLVSGVSAIGGFIIFLFTITSRYYQPDIAFAACLLAAACLGFLVYNFNPAKIFLGEGGSLLLGYILGVLAIISGGKIAIALLIMGVPVLDVVWTILRRLYQGHNPFRFADKNHLHHRLLALGLSQKKTVLVFYFLSLVFGLSGLFLQSRGKLLALAVLAGVMLIFIFAFWRLDRRTVKPSLLLHVCCAPCAAYISRDRLAPSYNLTWYFYNSNLDSLEEYNKRLAAVKLVAKKYRWPLIIEPYDQATWQKMASGHELDPERGARCQLCYRDRLIKTARLAAQKKFNYFSTSLLVSPYKDTLAIKAISRELAAEHQVKFLELDFQVDGGYQKSQALAKELGIYRQKFCGCKYSKLKN